MRVWLDQQVRAGKVSAGEVQRFWHQHGHDYLDTFKSLFPAGKDSGEGGMTVRLIIAEIGITGRYFIKRYGGRDHVVFKGYAGARRS